MSSRRGASARPPPGGGAYSLGRGLQIGMRARELQRALLDGFKQHDLLTYSSAISFQILTAVVPFVMSMLALAGLLHLGGVWRNHVAPDIRPHVSAAVFSVISSAVSKAFSGRQLLWATFGGGLALWQVSGAIRAVMGAFDRIYGASSERPLIRRYLISFGLAMATGACFIASTVCLVLAPFFAVRHPGAAWEVFAFLARWVLAVGFLSIAAEIELDRQSLLGLMERMGTSPNPVKQATGWLAEKVSRVKFATTMSDDDGAFMALETLAMGVEGKASMWRALKEVAGEYPSLATTNLDELIDRAEAQAAILERERLAAGRQALSNDATAPSDDPEATTPKRVNPYSAENPPTSPGRPASESAFKR